MKVLKKTIEEQRGVHATLLKYYENLKEEKSFWNSSKRKLEGKIKKSDEIRLGLLKELSSKKMAMNDLEFEKKNVEKNLRSEQKKKEKTVLKMKELKIKREKSEMRL